MKRHGGQEAETLLSQGLERMGIVLSQDQQQALLAYLALLQKWNKAFNLSGIKDVPTMISRHLLDSLSLQPFIAAVDKEPARIADVGTGPGLPGIPLAICFPQHQFILLDSNGKKTRFVFQAILALKLDNVQVENCRIEHYQSPAQIDIVVSRAFSSLAEMVEKTAHLGAAGEAGQMRWLAMKGQYPAAEIASLPSIVRTGTIARTDIPGDPGERHIIELIAMDPESGESEQ